jgi:hypothetical protein
MKSKFLFALFLLLTSTLSFAQDAYRYRYNILEPGEPLSYNLTPYGMSEAQLNSTEGSPYLDEEFTFGTIVSGDIVSKAYMRYNIYFEEIEVVEHPDSKDISALLKNPETKAVFNNKTFIFIQTTSSVEEDGYFQVLSQDQNFDLLVKSRIRYIPPFYATTSMQHDRPGRFDVENTFYLVSKQNRFIEIPNKESKLLKLITHKKGEVKSFLRTSKIDLRNEEDIKRFVNYYNRILKK